MPLRNAGYGYERRRNSAAYGAWWDACSDAGRPFVMVSLYRSHGRQRAKLTVDMITAAVPQMPDEVARWLRCIIAEHCTRGMRVHIDPVRVDVYGLEPALAHRLAATTVRLITQVPDATTGGQTR